jgi:hypothetical protein
LDGLAGKEHDLKKSTREVVGLNVDHPSLKWETGKYASPTAIFKKTGR